MEIPTEQNYRRHKGAQQQEFAISIYAQSMPDKFACKKYYIQAKMKDTDSTKLPVIV